MKRIKLEKQHYQWGLTAFLVIVCCVLVFFAIYRFDVLQTFARFCIRVLQPFIYGAVMAYLLTPIYNGTVRGTYGLLNQGSRQLKKDMAISKGVGTVISTAVLLVVIAGVSWMIIPGLVNSVVSVVEQLPAALEQVTQWLDVKMTNLPIAQETIDEGIDTLTDKAIEFATNTLLPKSQSVAVGVSQGVIGAVGFLTDFFIGIIISIYFLNSKDTFLAQIKKVITETLTAMGIQNAKVKAVDKGALDCVIKARTIAAAQRAAKTTDEPAWEVLSDVSAV